MSFISYAQNYEDVILSRALRGVERGFYIDVGAQDPVNDSVTKAFYVRGWCGINVEPVTHWFEKLVADRPRDINLQLAVSDAPGTLHLFEVVDSGLSTTDADFAKRHAEAGHSIRESDVPCVTLDSICENHQADCVHFLKIDCEGAEAAALRGLSLQRVRPWIILLEATEPNSQTPAYAEWEPWLTGRDYHFVYQDGLNRFYVANEHGELDESFSYPPNVFDYFVRASEASAREALDAEQADLVALRHNVEHLHNENERREEALVEQRRTLTSALEREALMQAEVLRLQREIGRLHHAVQFRDEEVARLHGMIDAILRSVSWRITYPVRLMRPGAVWLARAGLRTGYFVLRWPARAVRPLLRVLARSSRLRALSARVIGKDSTLALWFNLFLFGERSSAEPEEEAGQQAALGLTRQAERVLDEIQDARAARERSGITPGGV